MTRKTYKSLTLEQKEKIKDLIMKYYINSQLNIVDSCNEINKHYLDFTIGQQIFKLICKEFNITKSNEAIQNGRRNKMLKKYGTTSNFGRKNIREKIKQTTLEKYGVENVFAAEQIKEKIKQNMLDNYGVDNISRSDYFKKQMRYSTLTKAQTIPERTNSIIQNEKTFRAYFNNLSLNEQNMSFITKDLGFSKSYMYKIIRALNVKDLFPGYTSYGEYELNLFFNNLDIKNYKVKRKDATNYYEIDVFLPDYNIGVEFNGIYWHSTIYKDLYYHQRKSNYFKEKGIFIYHIFEHEWNDERKQKIIKSQLRNLCYKNENKIYARQCEIRELTDNKLIRQFLNENHLQGYRPSKIKLGLFYNNELVSLMTFGKPYLSKSNKYEWELYRFCNKMNTSVIGGFDKLFKYFINSYNPKNILTYSDIGKGTGNIYRKIGFTDICQTKPNYIWINPLTNDVKTRYQTQMKNEKEIMINQNYYIVPDCGNYKLEFLCKEII